VGEIQARIDIGELFKVMTLDQSSGWVDPSRVGFKAGLPPDKGVPDAPSLPQAPSPPEEEAKSDTDNFDDMFKSL